MKVCKTFNTGSIPVLPSNFGPVVQRIGRLPSKQSMSVRFRPGLQKNRFFSYLRKLYIYNNQKILIFDIVEVGSVSLTGKIRRS